MQELIGESGTLADALEHLSRVAGVDRPVLILGERGSGKELFAERLHFLSSRWNHTLHKINCAAFSDTLLDSELFGHEAGAFTGATKQRLGRFERADKGTLFLDEIATMPLRTQEKVLRLIEYGEFERLGGQQTITVDIRIAAATHSDLPKLAEQGKFRHDLLDRLAFDVIHVPPLRTRLEDIKPLVHFFATKMCAELGREYYSGFSDQALTALFAHDWPGNIRELKNVVERSVCHWDDADEPIDTLVINPFQTSWANTQAIPKLATESTYPINVSGTQPPFHEQVKTLELSLLRQALTQHQGHQQRSADSLGLSYHQMRALLRKYKEDLN